MPCPFVCPFVMVLNQKHLKQKPGGVEFCPDCGKQVEFSQHKS